MMQPSLLAATYALDWLVGDPDWLPHPVRLIGWSIRQAERTVRHCGSGKYFDLSAGGFVALAVPTASMLLCRAVLREMRHRHRLLGTLAELWLASTCLATRNLLDEATSVLGALDAGDVCLARLRLARIVGRDTAALDEPEICRAVIETLAESLSDGIIAPLFYLALGGVPLAMAYKAVNTLDSMIGHRDERYLYFGRVAARLDDAANFVPARFAATLVCIAAEGIHNTDGFRACAIWLRDGGKHASPNAGQVESGMAGALGVRLGGENRYGDERTLSPQLGREFPKPARTEARRALKVVALASLFGFGAALLLTKRSCDV
jgi:adenosylcobinamide-phosphate synthase